MGYKVTKNELMTLIIMNHDLIQRICILKGGQLLLAAWYLANDTIMNYEVDYKSSYHNFWKHKNW